jgi:hypothetical protein
MLASVMLEIIYPVIQFNIPQGLRLQYENSDNKESQTAFTKHTLFDTIQKPQWKSEHVMWVPTGGTTVMTVVNREYCYEPNFIQQTCLFMSTR